METTVMGSYLFFKKRVKCHLSLMFRKMYNIFSNTMQSSSPPGPATIAKLDKRKDSFPDGEDDDILPHLSLQRSMELMEMEKQELSCISEVILLIYCLV
jgi:hypothetical protein